MSGSVFEKNYRNYLTQISTIDFKEIADRLGANTCDDGLIIPFFGRPYRVSSRGILNKAGKKPAYSICVVLCKYILLCPGYAPTQDNWVAFKDFKDAAPLVSSFSNTTEGAITRDFSGKIDKLENA